MTGSEATRQITSIFQASPATCNGPGASGVLTIYFDGAVIGSTTAGTGGGFWGSPQACFFSGDAGGDGEMTNGGALCGMRCYNRLLAPLDVSPVVHRHYLMAVSDGSYLPN
jgi:hypothetical protein